MRAYDRALALKYGLEAESEAILPLLRRAEECEREARYRGGMVDDLREWFGSLNVTPLDMEELRSQAKSYLEKGAESLKELIKKNLVGIGRATIERIEEAVQGAASAGCELQKHVVVVIRAIGACVARMMSDLVKAIPVVGSGLSEYLKTLAEETVMLSVMKGYKEVCKEEMSYWSMYKPSFLTAKDEDNTGFVDKMKELLKGNKESLGDMVDSLLDYMRNTLVTLIT